MHTHIVVTPDGARFYCLLCGEELSSHQVASIAAQMETHAALITAWNELQAVPSYVERFRREEQSA